ncbi:Mov34/MPN/PAD-1 family protein [Ornithinibacillus scapharcae]|uniref:Mov34/MPN/PAD-1 family protein n=1 Tax=Ornithinibacillus scapharcae TaxID=1147159 RepID=UPI000225AB46|nr:M67 family metallopeptidase [Ornithinibacillus scapharcae]
MKAHLIPQELYYQLLQNCKDELPYEACGLLTGTQNLIRSIWPLKNELKSSNRFFVHQDQVQKTLETISSLNQQVKAIYHTHPNTEAIPSSIDIANHINQEVGMVIISYKSSEPIMKWYKIDGLNYTDCPFVVL